MSDSQLGDPAIKLFGTNIPVSESTFPVGSRYSSGFRSSVPSAVPLVMVAPLYSLPTFQISLLFLLLLLVLKLKFFYYHESLKLCLLSCGCLAFAVLFLLMEFWVFFSSIDSFLCL